MKTEIKKKIKYIFSRDSYISISTNKYLTLLLRKIRVALMPRNLKLKSKLKNGTCIQGYNKAGFGGRGIYIYREDIEPELKLLPEILNAGDVFIDIGANVGIYSITAAEILKGKNGMVIAIEPFPDTYSQLCENIKLNGFTSNIRTCNFCIDDKTAPSQLYLNHNRPNAFSLFKVENAESIPVLSVKLEDLVKWYEIDRLDYLKIDVEGAEFKILNSSRIMIDKFRPIIQIEWQNEKSISIFNNYLIFSVKNTRNLLLIPKEKYSLGIETILNNNFLFEKNKTTKV